MPQQIYSFIRVGYHKQLDNKIVLVVCFRTVSLQFPYYFVTHFKATEWTMLQKVATLACYKQQLFFNICLFPAVLSYDWYS